MVNANSTAALSVEPGGRGVVAHVGLHALGRFADRLQLGSLLSAHIAHRSERAPGHDRGKVLALMALVLAGGEGSCADIEHLRRQTPLFSHVPVTRRFFALCTSAGTGLQRQVDQFVLCYNEERPHQARGCPPMEAWRALDKATPLLDGQPILAKTRVRHDHVGNWGAVTLRYRRTLHHIIVGRAHRHQRVIILQADLDIRVVSASGELLRHFTLDPTRDYQARSRSSL